MPLMPRLGEGSTRQARAWLWPVRGRTIRVRTGLQLSDSSGIFQFPQNKPQVPKLSLKGLFPAEPYACQGGGPPNVPGEQGARTSQQAVGGSLGRRTLIGKLCC